MHILSTNYRITHKEIKNTFLIFLKAIFEYETTVTSDGKINLIYALFSNCKQLLILNGLGKYESNSVVRWLFIYSLRRKQHLIMAAQNYRDYRYFRRFSKLDAQIFWVPGSGGSQRVIGNSRVPVIITRQAKVKSLEARSLILNSMFDEVYVVGQIDHYFSRLFSIVGEVDQEDIFVLSNHFIQLDGYGEGIPHSLCDAIVSKMKITIEKTAYIKYGLYKHDLRGCKVSRNQNFITFDTLPSSLVNQLKRECVNLEYQRLCRMVNEA